jgi:uroporphyrinogen-III decarboxylase
LSCEDYERLILPFHKKLANELTDGTGKNSIHLCGDATHHFRKIQDELNVYSFDTGFPINFRNMLETLSPETQISGGVHINTLLMGSAGEIQKAVESICREVKPLSKKFIIRDANNLSPGTPFENIAAMYEAVREFGRFD